MVLSGHEVLCSDLHFQKTPHYDVRAAVAAAVTLKGRETALTPPAQMIRG